MVFWRACSVGPFSASGTYLIVGGQLPFALFFNECGLGSQIQAVECHVVGPGGLSWAATFFYPELTWPFSSDSSYEKGAGFLGHISSGFFWGVLD